MAKQKETQKFLATFFSVKEKTLSLYFYYQQQRDIDYSEAKSTFTKISESSFPSLYYFLHCEI